MSSVAVVHVPRIGGHFFEYGRCFVEAAKRVYPRVCVLLPQAALAPEIAGADWSGAEVIGYAPGLPALRTAPLAYRHLSDWLGVRRAFAKLQVPDAHMVLTFLDAVFLAFVPIPPPAGVSRVFALTMRADIGQHDQPPAVGSSSSASARSVSAGRRLKYLLWRHILRRGVPQMLATNDPCLYEQVQRDRLDGASRLMMLPDFSVCGSSCRPIAAAASPSIGTAVRPIVRCLAIGFLDRRKNLSLLLQAVQRYRQDGLFDLRLAFVGTLPDGELDEPAQVAFDALAVQQAVSLQSGHVSEADYCQAVARADGVWAVYANHDYASGVILDAMAAERGVIAQSTGVIGFYAARYSRAVMVPAGADVDAVVNALAEFCQRSQADWSGGRSGGYQDPPTLTLERPLDRAQYVDRISTALSSLTHSSPRERP